ncbi:hypothetical protein CC80DRAFT_549985 [Byssothecium circinans]|uniref:DUF7730 domain-containing protein n=1 Tax=Byssothecium circinans TaxID=147558 RepID=A0A6A5TRA5_9PLEO|nr:hypothetical protein CC80DRAFT_549985 [Byssothecium circinans]
MCFWDVFGWSSKPRRTPQPPSNPPKPRYRARPPISRKPRNQQVQCPLFNPSFPAELRIQVYEAALGDNERLMHVIPFDDNSNRVGRQRCKDTNSERLVWQHECFGTLLLNGGSSRRRQFEFWADDRLLALLLTCHRIYLEAIDILYSSNHFSLKGSRGIAAFKSVAPRFQWEKIRHVHISTIFLTPQISYPAYKHFPPDDYTQWPQACAILGNLYGLRSLQFEITIKDTSELLRAPVEWDTVKTILEPLVHISCPIFEVAMNIVVPDSVLAGFGRLPFTLTVHERQIDHLLHLL